MNEQNFGGSNIAAVVVIVLIIIGGVVFTMTREKPNTNSQNNNQQMTTMGPVQVNLSAQNNSGQSGTVTLTEDNGKTKVVINIPPASGALIQQPAHIHNGTCESLGNVRYTLNNVIDGKSETILTPTPHFIHGLGQLSINVHKSIAESNIYAACGNLTEAFNNAMHN